MLYRRYRVLLDSGKTVEKLFVAGAVVQIHDTPGAPFSFNLAVGRGEGREPIYVNRVGVRRDAPYLGALKRMRPGQQLLCEINIQVSDRLDKDGNPYENLWLTSFEWGRRPGDGKDAPMEPGF